MNEMKVPSTVVHKGEKEEKYKLYIEDYVISYLKYETGKLELSEIFFYGYREKNAKQYMIYGAGKDKHILLFDRYDLLEEVGCRLTQAGPFFIIRETDGTYEVKGYDIFYQTNEAMQNHLIDVQDSGQKGAGAVEDGKVLAKWKEYAPGMSSKAERVPKMHGWISVQLCAICILLVAIVITTTNSYDKMGQINQSAKEVFFAMENQTAQRKEGSEKTAAEDSAEKAGTETESEAKTNELEAAEDAAEAAQDDEETGTDGQEKADAAGLETEADSVSGQPDMNETEEKPEMPEQTAATEQQDSEEQTEALSRSVVRYYEIEKGDTLYGISQKIYGDTSKVDQICELNEISDPDNISYGQKIILP